MGLSYIPNNSVLAVLLFIFNMKTSVWQTFRWIKKYVYNKNKKKNNEKHESLLMMIGTRLFSFHNSINIYYSDETRIGLAP